MFFTALQSIQLSAVSTLAIINTVILILLFLYVEFSDTEPSPEQERRQHLVFPFIVIFSFLVLLSIAKQVIHINGI